MADWRIVELERRIEELEFAIEGMESCFREESSTLFCPFCGESYTCKLNCITRTILSKETNRL